LLGQRYSRPTSALFLDRDGVIIKDRDHICEPPDVFHMYRREHRNQLSFEDLKPFRMALGASRTLRRGPAAALEIRGF
jgi:hypothetical protein